MQAGYMNEFTGFLKALSTDYSLKKPYMYVTQDGEILAEWTFGDWEACVEYIGPERRLWASFVNLSNGAEHDLCLDIDSAVAGKELGEFICTNCI